MATHEHHAERAFATRGGRQGAGGGLKGRAHATAHALIQGYLGPDHKVIDMRAFYSALVQALREAQNPEH
jgi:hypothetical protein